VQLEAVLETVLYYAPDQNAEIRHFYVDVLGLRALGGGLGFRVGSSLLLLFDREQSTVQSNPPPHGSHGPIHTCFTTDPDDYGAWKARLVDNEVAIIDEIDWPNGVRSFYFHDPAGNVLEIADGDMWPQT
jgi:catechol 2,3-dioxygenase-like lactoylglutathione lyase family enzyme